MGKLIDADELYAAFRRDIMGGLNYDRILREAKPVDAVPVVRCKDCAHYGFTDNRIPEEQVWWCYFWDDVRSHDAYCSDGERKDGEHHD